MFNPVLRRQSVWEQQSIGGLVDTEVAPVAWTTGATESVLLRKDGLTARCVLASCNRQASAADDMRRKLIGNELLRYGRALHPRRQLSFLRGRTAAKDALVGFSNGRYVPQDFEIAAGVFEQPLVRGPLVEAGVSISHTDAMAVAIAFPNSHPVGIDVEQINPAHEAALNSQISAHDRSRVSALGVGRIESLTLVWSAKEALSKVLLGGLAVDFTAIEMGEARFADERFHLSFASFGHLRAEAIIGSGNVLALVVPSRCTADWSPSRGRRWLAGMSP